jgi:ATPase subunit of ABC transporter with duplicated ATPase domains
MDCGARVLIDAYEPLRKWKEQKEAKRQEERRQREAAKMEARGLARKQKLEIAQVHKEAKIAEREAAMLAHEQRTEAAKQKQAEFEKLQQQQEPQKAGMRAFRCPNIHCDFHGEVEGNPKFSMTTFILLLILLPLAGGIAYAILVNGYNYNCPKCAIKLA